MTTVESGPTKSLESYARFPLLFPGPSPIQKLERLTKHLGGATIWAKREDCNSPYAFGGNKARKLEYLVADASRGEIERSTNVLYAHLGGQPAIKGYASLFS